MLDTPVVNNGTNIPRWIIGGMLALLLVFGVLLALPNPKEGTNRAGNVTNTVNVNAQTGANPELWNHYKSGALISLAFGTERVCLRSPMQPLPRSLVCSDGQLFHLFSEDVVRVTDQTPVLLKDEYGEFGWYWQTQVVYGSIYTEGLGVWVADRAPIVAFTGNARAVPDFSVGERVRANYNFMIHSEPDGPVVECPADFCYVLGGQEVTLVSNPTFGKNGHYWCEVDTPGQWIYCEVQRIDTSESLAIK